MFWLAQYSTIPPHAMKTLAPLLYTHGCVVHGKYCTVQPQGIQKWVLHLCTPLTCTEKGDSFRMLHWYFTCMLYCQKSLQTLQNHSSFHSQWTISWIYHKLFQPVKLTLIPLKTSPTNFSLASFLSICFAFKNNKFYFVSSFNLNSIN